MTLGLLLQLGAGAMALTGYAIGWWFEPRRRARRALTRVQEARLADLRDGDRARVTGIARATDETTTSPIGQRSCIGFHVVVEEKTSGGAGANWHTLLVRSHCLPFGLVDGDAEAVVEGPFDLGLDPDDRGDVWSNLPPTLFAMLEEARIPLTGHFGRDKEFRFREALLRAGDRVSVLGRVSVEPHPYGHRENPRGTPLQCRVSGSDGQPVVIGDVDDLIASDSIYLIWDPRKGPRPPRRFSSGRASARFADDDGRRRASRTVPEPAARVARSAVVRAARGHAGLGMKSNFYIDCKQTVLTAEGHFLVGSLFNRILSEQARDVEAIGGLTMGADPLASAVSTVSYLAGARWRRSTCARSRRATAPASGSRARSRCARGCRSPCSRTW